MSKRQKLAATASPLPKTASFAFLAGLGEVERARPASTMMNISDARNASASASRGCANVATSATHRIDEKTRHVADLFRSLYISTHRNVEFFRPPAVVMMGPCVLRSIPSTMALAWRLAMAMVCCPYTITIPVRCWRLASLLLMALSTLIETPCD